MKTRILIVEDIASEMKKAREAAEKLGLDVICCDPTNQESSWVELMEGVAGVATDLFWRYGEPTIDLRYGGGKNPNYHPSRPSGLLVVIHALSKGLPVVVCSDVGDSNKFVMGHHGPEAGFIYDGYRGKTTLRRYGKTQPTEGFTGAFGWQDGKDWDWVLQCLSLTITARQATPRSPKR